MGRTILWQKIAAIFSLASEHRNRNRRKIASLGALSPRVVYGLSYGKTFRAWHSVTLNDHGSGKT